MRKKMLLAAIGTVAALAVTLIAALLFSVGLKDNQSVSRFPISIHEIVASNSRFMSADGICCDWVELYNNSDQPIDISGYKLTDKENEARFTVPDGTVIDADGFVVIWCDAATEREGYAPFGISKDGGETVILMTDKNVLVDRVETVRLEQNESMARQADGTFAVCAEPTPNFPNTAEGYDAYLAGEINAVDSIEISEVLAANTFYQRADGNLCDFVELHNTAAEPVAIGGYLLSDNREEMHFTVPDGTVIEANGYFVIHCCREHGGAMVADFSISRDGNEEIVLLNREHNIVDRFVTVSSQRNAAMVRDVFGGVETMDFATPGFENSEAGFRAYLASLGTTAPVIISEVMTDNAHYPDANGRLYDYIELHNTTDQPFDLSGYGLSDRADRARFRFADGTTIDENGYLVVYCSSDAAEPIYGAFGLSAMGGEVVYLTDAAGGAVDAVITVAAPINHAQIRTEDGALMPVSFASPWYENTEAGAQKVLAESKELPKIRISEWMAANKSTILDSMGQFSDYVEIYNAGDVPVMLGSLYLTDSAADPYQFRLPEITLEAGKYLLVFCSGKERLEGEIHAPFGLSASGDSILLCTASGEVVDSVTYDSAEDDRAFVRAADGSFTVTAYPTPNEENTEAGYIAALAAREPIDGIAISEVMPSNRTYLRFRFEYYDWVELVNYSDKEISLKGYTLSDAFSDPDRCVLPDVTLAPNETFIVYCSGDASLSTEWAFHAELTLSAAEDTLYLFAPDGSLADYVHVFDVPYEGSIGRADGEAGFSAFEKPTPQEANGKGTAFGIPSAMPTADVQSGVYENTDKLKVSLSGRGTIYYTLDGSTPTERARVYEKPITVDKTTVIRAVCIEEGHLAGDILTLSYILNEGHDLPVVSLVADPEDLFGLDGIYANPLEDWEREGSVSFFEKDGSFVKDCGVRISGQTSRKRDHKSFRLVFSSRHDGELRYPVYGEDYKVQRYTSLTLRAGLDARYGILREHFFSKIAMPHRDTTIVQKMRPVVVYVNAEYYGIYYLAETYTEELYADIFDVSPESVSITKGYLYDEEHEMLQLINYAVENDCSDPKHYAYLEERIDMLSFVDWAIFQAYFSNGDLPGNVRYIKCSENGNKYRFALYDTECGMAFNRDTACGTFDFVFINGQTATLIRALCKSDTFRELLFERLVEHCQTTFVREDVLEYFEACYALIESEARRNFERWDLDYGVFESNIKHIRWLVEVNDRPKRLVESLSYRLKLTEAEQQKYFGAILNG